MFDESFKFSLKWIVPTTKFSPCENGHYFESDIFQANLPGLSYSLRCYPNGDTGKHKDKVSLFLVLHMGMMKSVFCQFTYHVKSTHFSKTLRATYICDQYTWGCPIYNEPKKFLSSKFVADNEFIVEVEGTMKGKGFNLYEPVRRLIIQAMFQRPDKDVMILADGRKIEAHKSVLKSRSKVFASMVQSEDTITIPEFSYTAIKAVIDFCYDICITSEISDSTITELLIFSNKFEMNGLKITMESLLIQKLSDDTVIHLSNLSIKCNAKELRECCVCYLLLLKNHSNPMSKLAKFFANLTAKPKPKSVAEYLLKKKAEDPMGIKNIHELDKAICDEIINRAFAETECIQQSF